MNKVQIDQKELTRLLDSDRKLACLEAGGVDNWEFYSDSLADYFKEKEIEDAIHDTIQELNDIFTEAEVDQPAGQGCGYSITWDDDAVFRVIKGLISRVKEGD